MSVITSERDKAIKSESKPKETFHKNFQIVHSLVWCVLHRTSTEEETKKKLHH